MPSLRDLAKADLSLSSLRMPRIGLPSFGGGGSRTAVGLDVQPGYVAAVQAHLNGRLVVEHAAGAALPPETMREGEVMDEDLLSEALQELFKDARLPRTVRLGIANQRTVLRVLEMPPIDDRKSLEAAVRFQAQDHMPMPLANAVLDFQPLGMVDTPAGPRQQVVVVAAQREMVAKLLAAAQAAGLRPVGVDLSAFAMIRAMYRGQASDTADGGQMPPEGEVAAEEQPLPSVLYLNVGGLTNLAIAEGLACRFTRMVSGGLESMAAELASRHGIPLADARSLLANIDLRVAKPASAETPPAPENAIAPEQDAQDGGEVTLDGAEHAEAAEPAEHTQAFAEDQPKRQDEAVREARHVLENGLRDIAGEIRNSLDFHRSQGGGEVSDVVLSGAALEIDGFATALEAELGFHLVARRVELADESQTGSAPADRLAVAAGLAVEEVSR